MAERFKARLLDSASTTAALPNKNLDMLNLPQDEKYDDIRVAGLPRGCLLQKLKTATRPASPVMV
jgi:hypothetical protein